MEDFISDNSGNLANAIESLKNFDGRKPREFREWHKKLAVVLGVTRRDIARLIKGQTRPTQEPANEDLYAILYLLTDKPAALLVAKHEDTAGTSGNGQRALLEIVSKYKKVTDEVILSTMDKLVNTMMKPGQDPDDDFMEKTLARAELEKMSEPISDRRFKDICV